MESQRQDDGDYGGENEIDRENRGDIERDGSSEKRKQLAIKGRKRKIESGDKPPPKKQCGKIDRLVQGILCRDQLTDEHMSFANKLLEEQFPFVGGMQSILLAQNNGFIPVLNFSKEAQKKSRP